MPQIQHGSGVPAQNTQSIFRLQRNVMPWRASTDQHAQASVPELRKSICFSPAAATLANGSRLQKSGPLFCLEKPVIALVLGLLKNCSTLIGGPSVVCLYGFRSCSRILQK